MIWRFVRGPREDDGCGHTQFIQEAEEATECLLSVAWGALAVGCFDLITAALSIADIAADIAVTIEFQEQGRELLFLLSLAIFPAGSSNSASRAC